MAPHFFPLKYNAMDFKKLNKATEIFKKIQELDAEILIIDKLAMKAANGENVVELILNVTDLKEKAKKEAEKVTQQEEGVYIHFIHFKPSRLGDPPKTEVGLTSYKHDLTDVGSLEVFGLLLGDKMRKRDTLLKKLQELGVKI